MSNLIQTWLRLFFTGLGRVISPILFKITIEGREHLPPRSTRPLLLIANHFSWFDAPLVTLHIPHQPAFLVASEAMKVWWIRFFLKVFRSIPIWRGQVDRNALRLATDALARGIVVGIFPEGGMNPANAARLARGEQIHELRGNISRSEAVLAEAKAGAALLALQSRAHILPVAVMGTQAIPENLRRWRRTPITFRIGPVFGPLELDPTLKGPERRARLDALSHSMMARVAALFPPEQRGPYAEPNSTLPNGSAARHPA